MAELTVDDIRQAIREETPGIVRTIVTEEVRSLGVKFEDLESKVDTALESISKDLKLKNKITDHEARLTALETDQVLLKSTVKLHSRQLKTA